MCLIVDASLCSVVFKKTSDTNYQQLRETIFGNRIKLVHGGKLTIEYSKAGVLPVIALLAQSGMAKKIDDKLIEVELKKVEKKCSSNDEHVIALARADRKSAHLLCSDDEHLRADFKNKELIDLPRGKIYSCTRHKQSLANC